MGTVCSKTENQQNSLKIKTEEINTNTLQKDILKNYSDLNTDKQSYIKSLQQKQKKTFNKSLPCKTKEEKIIYNYHNKYPDYQIDYFTQREKFISLKDLNKCSKHSQQIKLFRTIKCKEDKILGNGSYGTVTRGFDLNNRLAMAIKRIYLGPEREFETNKKELIKEVDFLKDLQHPNIVKYYGYEIDKDYLKIYLEYIDMGSISSMLKKHGSFPEEIVINYTKQILEGLKYLHSKGVIHRDIKGANILVSNDGQVKLSDFGSARKLQQSLIQTVKGTTSWMAPEVMKDMLIYGVQDVQYMKCQLVNHHFKLEISLKVINFKEENFNIKKNLSKLAQDFILSCMRKSPYDRKNVIKLLDHPFLIKQQNEFEKDLFDGQSELKFEDESFNHQFKCHKKYKNQDYSTALYSNQNSKSQIRSKNSSLYDQKIREIYQKLNETKKKKRNKGKQITKNKKTKLFKINFDESF